MATFSKQAVLRDCHHRIKSHRPRSPCDRGQGEGPIGAQTLFYFFNCTNFLSVAQGVRNRVESHRHCIPEMESQLGAFPGGLCRGMGTPEAKEAGALLLHAPVSDGQSAVWPRLDDQ